MKRTCRLTRCALRLLLPLIVITLAAPPVWAEVQTFDSAATAAAAGWIGSGNTSGPNNYGFSASNIAGGIPGEAGGTIAVRTTDFTYYADTTLIGPHSQQSPLFASGKFSISSFAFDGGFEIGFFNAASTTKATGNGVGGIDQAIAIRVLDGGRMVVRAGNDGSSDSPVGTFVGGVDYRFDMLYDPNGGGAGVGSLVAAFHRQSDNVLVDTRSATFPSTGSPYNLNAFGIVTLDFDRDDVTTQLFIDDVQYSNTDRPAPNVQLGIECQMFDDAASAAAAGWAGLRNRDGALNTDYGFSNSNFAGGAAGELGGIVPGRTSVISNYADTTLGGSLSQKLPLTATGRFSVNSIEGFDGGFEIGFFDATATDGTAALIGTRLVDGAGNSLRWGPRRDVNGAGEAIQGSDQLVMGEDYLFELTYDPNGGGAGLGRVSIEFVRASDNVSLGVRSIDFSSLGAEVNLNAFGIKTLDFNANIGGRVNISLDDLKYTQIVPEPSACLLGLAGMGISCIAAGRRRRP